jgi:N-acyl-D-amino-acid deacylase
MAEYQGLYGKTASVGLLIALTTVGQAWADDAATRVAVQKSLPLLARSDQMWFKKQSCASCHHQALPLMAFREARQRGISIPEDVVREQADKTVALYRSPGALDRAIQGSTILDPGLSESYFLVAAHAAGLPPSPVLAARMRFVAYRQMPQGYWRAIDYRPPLLGSVFSSTALTLRAIQLYLAPFTPEDAGRRVLRAKQWLLRASAFDTEDLAYQLLGLGWAGASAPEIRPFARRLPLLLVPSTKTVRVGPCFQLEALGDLVIRVVHR